MSWGVREVEGRKGENKRETPRDTETQKERTLPCNLTSVTEMTACALQPVSGPRHVVIGEADGRRNNSVFWLLSLDLSRQGRKEEGS